ncbi:MAG: hypothetical protein HY744_01695 [Deltaproteobacteria bacterium]|nr:hypothetical protein [Deltaproteobacteria bacterium]
MRFVLGLHLLGLATAVAVACAGKDESGKETLCVPGENIFCRCRGGAAGTKQCLDDGNSFGSCETSAGDCDEAPGQPPGGGSGGASVPPGGGGAPPSEPGQLLAPCADDAACDDGLTCPGGYCTKPCTSYDQCAPPEPAEPGDCVKVKGHAWCVPYCLTQADCEPYGPDSRCGYTPDALPPYDVVVCADWGESPQLPPDGYPPDPYVCEDDAVCNLGLQHVERICQNGSCMAGCHESSDCSSPGVECAVPAPSKPGTCGAATGNVDACPGEPVTISIAGGEEVVTGSTAELPKPGDAKGTGDCAGTATDTEEAVYAVLPQDSGQLIALLEVQASYDPMLYVRQAPCESGQQIACSDEPGEGKDEIVELAVQAGHKIYIFVDGWDGSTGVYKLTLDLSK